MKKLIMFIVCLLVFPVCLLFTGCSKMNRNIKVYTETCENGHPMTATLDGSGAVYSIIKYEISESNDCIWLYTDNGGVIVTSINKVKIYVY